MSREPFPMRKPKRIDQFAPKRVPPSIPPAEDRATRHARKALEERQRVAAKQITEANLAAACVELNVGLTTKSREDFVAREHVVAFMREVSPQAYSPKLAVESFGKIVRNQHQKFNSTNAPNIPDLGVAIRARQEVGLGEVDTVFGAPSTILFPYDHAAQIDGLVKLGEKIKGGEAELVVGGVSEKGRLFVVDFGEYLAENVSRAET